MYFAHDLGHEMINDLERKVYFLQHPAHSSQLSLEHEIMPMIEDIKCRVEDCIQDIKDEEEYNIYDIQESMRERRTESSIINLLAHQCKTKINKKFKEHLSIIAQKLDNLHGKAITLIDKLDPLHGLKETLPIEDFIDSKIIPLILEFQKLHFIFEHLCHQVDSTLCDLKRSIENQIKNINMLGRLNQIGVDTKVPKNIDLVHILGRLNQIDVDTKVPENIDLVPKKIDLVNMLGSLNQIGVDTKVPENIDLVHILGRLNQIDVDIKVPENINFIPDVPNIFGRKNKGPKIDIDIRDYLMYVNFCYPILKKLCALR